MTILPSGFKIDGKIYRNLVEQVIHNTELLSELDVETLMTLPDAIDEINDTLEDLAEEIGQAFGKTGTITLLASEWQENQTTRTFSDIGDSDFIEFFPDTKLDEERMSAAGIFSSRNSGSTTVTFTVDSLPNENITMTYVITRGQRTS